MFHAKLFWWQFTIIFFLGILLSSCGSGVDNKVAEEIKQQLQNHNNTITIYSLPDYPQTYQAVTALKIYGFSPNLITIESPDEVKNLFPPEIAADLLSNKLNLPLFVMGNGQVVPSEIFYAAIKQLEIVSFEPEKKKPYVILYGVANCPRTAAAKNALDARGVRYEYVDINSDAARYIGEIEAKLSASDGGTGWRPPILEVDDYVWQDSEAIKQAARL